jgi:hypothetical protein
MITTFDSNKLQTSVKNYMRITLILIVLVMKIEIGFFLLDTNFSK